MKSRFINYKSSMLGLALVAAAILTTPLIIRSNDTSNGQPSGNTASEVQFSKAAPGPANGAPASCQDGSSLCVAPKLNTVQQLQQLSSPPIGREKPIEYTYNVVVDGADAANVETFKKLSAETMADTRGWAYLNIVFKEVPANGNFQLIFASASQVPNYGGMCDTLTHCTTGNNVVVNQDLWLTASKPWIAAGQKVRDYQHLAVTHVVGHWIGVNKHFKCSGSGKLAPVLMHQSDDLQGCVFNPWPLQEEFEYVKAKL